METNFTVELCPHCGNEVLIYSKGITACPNCGEPVAPCSICEDCSFDTCPYGCKGIEGDCKLKITNPPITQADIDFHEKEIIEERKLEASNPKETSNYIEHQKIISEISIAYIVKAVEYIEYLSALLDEQISVDDKDTVLEPLEKIIKKADTGRICLRCGLPLYVSDLPQYDTVCIECDENF